jgi:hypothetical protein
MDFIPVSTIEAIEREQPNGKIKGGICSGLDAQFL